MEFKKHGKRNSNEQKSNCDAEQTLKNTNFQKIIQDTVDEYIAHDIPTLTV
jgi:hypothetical protein